MAFTKQLSSVAIFYTFYGYGCGLEKFSLSFKKHSKIFFLQKIGSPGSLQLAVVVQNNS